MTKLIQIRIHIQSWIFPELYGPPLISFWDSCLDSFGPPSVPCFLCESASDNILRILVLDLSWASPVPSTLFCLPTSSAPLPAPPLHMCHSSRRLSALCLRPTNSILFSSSSYQCLCCFPTAFYDVMVRSGIARIVLALVLVPPSATSYRTWSPVLVPHKLGPTLFLPIGLLVAAPWFSFF
jgi:hypothetical protein